MIWTGALRGAPTGEVTVRAEYTGAEADRAQPVWGVRALIVAATDDVIKSFAGDLRGTPDWRAGQMQLSGTVTDGWRRIARSPPLSDNTEP
jgi:hypothetical protein